MSQSRPIEFTFDAKQKVPGLDVVARLNATNEFAEAAIQIVVRNVQAAVGPCPTEVGAHIRS